MYNFAAGVNFFAVVEQLIAGNYGMVAVNSAVMVGCIYMGWGK